MRCERRPVTEIAGLAALLTLVLVDFVGVPEKLAAHRRALLVLVALVVVVNQGC